MSALDDVTFRGVSSRGEYEELPRRLAATRVVKLRGAASSGLPRAVALGREGSSGLGAGPGDETGPPHSLTLSPPFPRLVRA